MAVPSIPISLQEANTEVGVEVRQREPNSSETHQDDIRPSGPCPAVLSGHWSSWTGPPAQSIQTDQLCVTSAEDRALSLCSQEMTVA